MSDYNKFFTPIYVIKRNGRRELADFSKVDQRLNGLNSRPYQLSCNASFVAQKVRDEITDGIDTKLLDEYAAKVSAELGAHNPEFLVLAARIAASNHQKNTSDCFSNAVDACYRNKKMNGKPAPRVNAKLYKFVQIHKTRLNKMVDYQRDFMFTYFGFTTLMDRYLIKSSGPRKLVELRPQDYAIERPQDMWMRTACAIHMNRGDLEDETVLSCIDETYQGLSEGRIMHATPTLYNAGTDCEQFLSCFLLGGEDSISGIFKLVADAAEISKYSGGIGAWWDLRSSGSEVQTTNGTSDGPIPFLRVLAATLQAVNQGGKRPGSGADYKEPTHPDFMRWVKLKRSGEIENIDTLFYAVWCPDEFMRRVERDEMWYFADPHDQPYLYTLYDSPENQAWTREYERIIHTKAYHGEPIKARAIMNEICRTECETGMPYMLFKDACNSKSNQQNIGTIKCSNLCVAADTPILTSSGWFEISKLENQVVPIWNGCEFSNSLVQQTSESADLLQIQTSDGCYVLCTPHHIFMISGHDVPAKDLKVGDRLNSITKLPVIDCGPDFPYAYTGGVFSGVQNQQTVELDNDRAHLLSRIEYADATHRQLPLDIPEKYTVPINYSLKSKLRWLAGLVDITGSLTCTNGIELQNTDAQFLLDVKLLCQTLSVNPQLHKSQIGLAFRLTFSSMDTETLYNLGFSTHHILYINVAEAQAPVFTCVTDIQKLSDREKTYCFGEPKLNQGMFNGLLLKNCAEILEYSSSKEYACCCVSSICLPKFVIPCDCATVAWTVSGHVESHQQGCTGVWRVDYDDIARWAGVLVRNLNKIIDNNFYPVPETRRSNMRHRPLAVGVQGLADMFHILKYPFTSDAARDENKRVFETIYWGCIKASNDLAKEDGAYETFLGDPLNNPEHPNMPSPFAQGRLQFDMWGLTKDDLMGRWDWDSMKASVQQYGTRNSLLTSLPPTASTSHIQGNNECLHGDTRIVDCSGVAEPISRIQNAFVIGYAPHTMVSSRVIERFDQDMRDTIQLTFIDNKTIICTPDHKFLRADGQWIEAQNISDVDNIVAGVDGTLDIIGDDEQHFTIDANTLMFDMAQNRSRTLAFVRILGYALSDGAVNTMNYRPHVNLCLDTAFDVAAITRDIELLEGIAPTVYDTGNLMFVSLHSLLSIAITTLPGISLSKRTGQPASLPTFITSANCPRSVVREFLAGLMGGAGDIQVKSCKLEMSTHPNYMDTLHGMLENISGMFSRLGVHNSSIGGPFANAKITNKLHDPRNVTLSLSFPDNTEFMDNVGVRYNINKLYRLTIASMYWRYQTTNITTSLPEFIKRVSAEFVYQDYAVSRTAITLPVFHTQVIACAPAGRHRVWDISVDDTHSFLANGVMVHNCFEPYTDNIYVRKTLSGENMVINHHLIRDLIQEKLWTTELRSQLIAARGSVQRLTVPDWIKQQYKTVWELDGPTLVDMDAERAPFIDQTQSSNRFMLDPTAKKLMGMHMRCWRKGLKTGMYYLRSQSGSKAKQFSETIKPIAESEMTCQLKKENGVMCYSCT